MIQTVIPRSSITSRAQRPTASDAGRMPKGYIGHCGVFAARPRARAECKTGALFAKMTWRRDEPGPYLMTESTRPNHRERSRLTRRRPQRGSAGCYRVGPATGSALQVASS